MDKEEYKEEVIDKRQELRKGLSPEEKSKRLKLGGRKFRRKNMMSNDTSINTLYKKIGKIKDEFRLFELKTNEDINLLKDATDTLLTNMEEVLTLPLIVAAIEDQVLLDAEESIEEEPVEVKED